jgi:hypothetical protein
MASSACGWSRRSPRPRKRSSALQRADAVAVRLPAARRYGKTSLLAAQIDATLPVGHRAVSVDFSQVATVADAAARLARSLAT